MTHFRPSWDDYFMAIAKIIAARGTCDRAHVGAVLVKNKRIISTGYNGAPPGLPHCDGPEGHLMEEGHCIRTVHAEENTILQIAAVGGTSAGGSTLYTTHSPCYHCVKKIVVAGVKRVVAGQAYRINEDVRDALAKAGVALDMYEQNPEWNTKLAEIFTAPPMV
jgi:dCMP deaminase